MTVKNAGMTLIELVIVVAIIALLAAIAVPGYRQYVLKGNRAEGQSALMQLAAAQEKFYLQNNEYTDQVAAAPPAGLGLMATTERGFYDIAVALGPDNQSYTATATPVAGAGQADDTRCTGFSISDTGYRDSTGPGGRDFCWR